MGRCSNCRLPVETCVACKLPVVETAGIFSDIGGMFFGVRPPKNKKGVEKLKELWKNAKDWNNDRKLDNKYKQDQMMLISEIVKLVTTMKTQLQTNHDGPSEGEPETEEPDQNGGDLRNEIQHWKDSATVWDNETSDFTEATKKALEAQADSRSLLQRTLQNFGILQLYTTETQEMYNLILKTCTEAAERYSKDPANKSRKQKAKEETTDENQRLAERRIIDDQDAAEESNRNAEDRRIKNRHDQEYRDQKHTHDQAKRQSDHIQQDADRKRNNAVQSEQDKTNKDKNQQNEKKKRDDANRRKRYDEQAHKLKQKMQNPKPTRGFKGWFGPKTPPAPPEHALPTYHPEHKSVKTLLPTLHKPTSHSNSGMFSAILHPHSDEHSAPSKPGIFSKFSKILNTNPAAGAKGGTKKSRISWLMHPRKSTQSRSDAYKVSK
jgi:hypothetical protein